jgi:hypothetical protein
MKKFFFNSLFSSPEGFIPHPSDGYYYQILISGKIMKHLKSILTLIIIFFMSFTLIAQDINVQKAVGKKRADVIKLFGNPVHQDNSNPSMRCMFYKGTNYTLTFVADEEGVYQAEASATYEDEAKARSVIDDLLQDCGKEFKIDSVSASDFGLSKPGVRADVQLAENKLSKKYDIRIKAVRSEN